MVDDPYRAYPMDRQSFGTRGRVIIAGEDMSPVPKSIVTLTAGDITVVPAGCDPLDGTFQIPFINVPSGYSPPWRVRMVVAFGSGCTAATVED